MSRARLTVLAFAATTLVAAGCGNSTSTTTSTTTASTSSEQPSSLASNTTQTSPLTRTELIAKADAICQRISTRRNLLKFGRSASLAVILPQLAAYQQALATELSKLTPPTSMTGTWTQILADARTLASSTAELNQYAQTNNAKAGRPLPAIFAHARLELRATSKSVGLTACATY
jgi:hypothetical protein